MSGGRKRKEIDDSHLFLYSCVIGVILWTLMCSRMCVDMFDQFLMVVYPLFLLMLPFMFRKLNNGKTNYDDIKPLH